MIISNGDPYVMTHKITRSRFTPYEDKRLRTLVKKFGTSDWVLISENIPNRSARQCRDRWNHYLNPHANTSEWSADEDKIIVNGLKKYGKHWTCIASLLPGRSSVAVRNRSCKLSRRADSDPFIKELLKNEYIKKKDREQYETAEEQKQEQKQNDNEEDQSIQEKIKLPSCFELLEEAGITEVPIVI